MAVLITNRPNQVTVSAPGPQGPSGSGGVSSLVAGSVIAVSAATGAVTVSHGAKAATGTALPWPSSITIDGYGHVVASGLSKVPLEASSNLSDVANASTARNNLGLTIGTTAGDVVVLDGSAKLPAVDGSQLTLISDNYTGQIETAADKTYTIDPSAVHARTVTAFYARSGAGTCTATLKNAAATVGTVSVTTSSGLAASIANASVLVDGLITVVVSSNSAATDVIFSVEYTQ